MKSFLHPVKKLFMEAVWSAAGKEVTGNYWGTPFLGTITSVRAKYGTDLEVTVEADGEMHLIDASTLYDGGNGVYENLHIYL